MYFAVAQEWQLLQHVVVEGSKAGHSSDEVDPRVIAGCNNCKLHEKLGRRRRRDQAPLRHEQEKREEELLHKSEQHLQAQSRDGRRGETQQ